MATAKILFNVCSVTTLFFTKFVLVGRGLMLMELIKPASPTNLLSKLLGLRKSRVACASPATAFASCVFPVPGGP